MPSIAERFNTKGLVTCKGARFTSFSTKDMLACRFYKGVIELNGEEFPGLHQRIISDTLFERVELMRLRKQRAPKRTRGGKTGILRKLTCCANCGKSLHSERNHRGHPMYRERHGQGCPTDGRSIAANRIDTQIGQVFGSIRLSEAWQDRMVSLVQAEHPKADLDVLRARKTRIARAYVDGGLSEAEYSDRLREIDDQLQALEKPVDQELSSAAELFHSVAMLWDEATPVERQRLVAPLLDRVYIDIDTKQIEAIVPAPAFKPLLDGVVERSSDAKCVIIGPEGGPQTERGSVWWRRGRADLGDEHNVAL